MSLLPEIYRYALLDLRRNALLGAFALTQAVAACVTFVVYESEGDRATISPVLLGIAALTWVVLGVQRASAAVSHERAARTWDFQRMTPQSGWTLATGKLLGAALFPTAAAGFFAPWIVLPLRYASEDYVRVLPQILLAILAAWLLIMTFSLMASSFMTGERRSPTAAIAIVAGLCALSVFVNPIARSLDRPFAFYGQELSFMLFGSATLLAFAVWTLAASAWRIGEDLLETPRLWRLPLFVLFLAFYVFGLPFPEIGPNEKITAAGAQALVAFGVATAFCYLAPLSSRESLEHWRDWLHHWKGAERWHRTPIWVNAWVTLAVTGVALGSLVLVKDVVTFMAAVLAFVLRDFLVLQLFRTTRLRAPEAWAVLTVALAYGLPSLVVAASRTETFQLVMPVDALSVASGAAQSLALAFWFLAILRRGGRPA